MTTLEEVRGQIRSTSTNFGFPMSHPMVGSVIPGIRIPLPPGKIANYPDGTRHPLIKETKTVDPMVKYPDMGQEHGENHAFMNKLRGLMGMKPQEKTLTQTMKHGYEPLRENRDWRHS